MYATCILTLKNIISSENVKKKLYTSPNKLWLCGDILDVHFPTTFLSDFYLFSIFESHPHFFLGHFLWEHTFQALSSHKRGEDRGLTDVSCLCQAHMFEVHAFFMTAKAIAIKTMKRMLSSSFLISQLRTITILWGHFHYKNAMLRGNAAAVFYYHH